MKCWQLCTRQAWGPLDVGAAYLRDSEAWSGRNHELAMGLSEIGRIACGKVLVRGDKQSDPYQAATAALVESTDTVVVAHPPTPVSCTAVELGQLIDWCFKSKGLCVCVCVCVCGGGEVCVCVCGGGGGGGVCGGGWVGWVGWWVGGWVGGWGGWVGGGGGGGGGGR